MYKKYTDDDYIYLHNLVNKAKEEDSLKFEVILLCNNFIEKYISVICHGKFINDIGIKKFLRRFMSNKVKYVDYRSNSNSTYMFIDIAKYVQELYSSFPEEEIRNSLYLVMVKMIIMYKSEQPAFHTFLKKCLHYNVYMSLIHLIADPASNLNRSEFIEEHEELYEENFDSILLKLESKSRVTNNKLAFKYYKSPYDNAFLNINWENGYVTDEVFSQLNTLERRILKYYYIDKKRDSDMCEVFCLSREKINIMRNNAVKKLYDICLKEKVVNNGHC